MKTRVSSTVFRIILMVLITGSSLLSRGADSLSGRWDLKAAGPEFGYPCWIEVSGGEAGCRVRYVGRVGSVRDIGIVPSEGGMLSFTHAEWFGQYEPLRHELYFTNGLVTGTFARTNGQKFSVTGRRAPSLDRPAPAVWTAPRDIFNGRDFSGWTTGAENRAPDNWRVQNGELVTFKGGPSLRTRELFDDFKLHIEFNCPTNANSGIYLRGRYEVQIEDDSIKAPPDQQTGGIYGFLGPDKPQARRPGQWRALDVTLVGRRATVVLDGVTLFANRQIPGITGGAYDSDEAAPGPIDIQASHSRDGGELRFRNIRIATPQPREGIRIEESLYEGRPQFVIRTPEATWQLDRAAGGFSRLIDRDGRDWISFRKDPLSKFPDSAGAGYRGIPNMVFGPDNPEAGAGHPGFDQCESALVSSNVIRTVSKTGRWAWTWTFVGDTARMRMERAPTNSTWWFLYEGTVGGRWSPATHYWGTDKGGPNRQQPDIKNQLFDRWRWAYFGDDASPRVLFIAQTRRDDLTDTLWYLGAENGGAINSTNGMVVFGLGRGPNTTSLFRGPGQEFVLGFHGSPIRDTVSHNAIAAMLEDKQ